MTRTTPAAPPPPRPVVVVDLGGQYARLIARRLRELGVYSEIVAAGTPSQEILATDPSGIVLSGGPASVTETDAPAIDPHLLAAGIPVLGICYGMQLMARELGGSVTSTGASEYGRTGIDGTATPAPDSLAGRWLAGAPRHAWMSHRDTVVTLPDGFAATATSPLGIAAMEDPDRRLYGVQFHPEVGHTDAGAALLHDFVTRIACTPGNWTPQNIIDQQVAAIHAQVGDGRAICALSGGVDSAVAAVLAHRALGDRLTCVFVDHGLMRAGEADAVVQSMRDVLGMNLVAVDAADRFLARLDGVTDPEAKRRIIGEEFIRVFEEQAAAVTDVSYLVQGTLYSDVVESGGDGSEAATIKSHHNVGGLPEQMDLELVEPLRLLFKDEVRRVGRALRIPAEIIDRQPFPGPGLAIRIIGEVTRERRDLLATADAIVRQELDRWPGELPEIWQAFAVLPVMRSVGVQGDARTYAHPIAIRAVASDDAMTADWVRIPYELLDHISRRITNEVPGVNRVLLDITSKPPATIEWE